MTQLNELQRYAGKNREVWLYHTYNRWTCTLRLEDKGIKLEVHESADTPEAAYSEASAKYDRILDRGAPELGAKQIEHRPIEEAPQRPLSMQPGIPPKKPRDDDDIPF